MILYGISYLQASQAACLQKSPVVGLEEPLRRGRVAPEGPAATARSAAGERSKA